MTVGGGEDEDDEDKSDLDAGNWKSSVSVTAAVLVALATLNWIKLGRVANETREEKRSLFVLMFVF